ncbi:MFS transporter [Bombiscardovia coagulans]|uniref:MFS transporter n=1 Tax=Bombiscardovia coagulans TaxID=686666 RepID=A0A261EVH1_9BIFI|nr:MFS transporter [Bombiscardovia coagulans]OZG50858.1 MFS transporter [Bombiscardovia coagulans]
MKLIKHRLPRAFNEFWISQSLSMVGDEANDFVWTMVLITGYSVSAEYLSMVNSLVQAITIVIPLVVVPLIKKYNVFVTTAVLDFARGILYVLCGCLWIKHVMSLTLFVAIIIVTECLGRIFSTLVYTAPIYLVCDDDRITANSRMSLSESVSRITGPPLGSWVVNVFNTAGAFFFNSLTFFISFVGSFLVRNHGAAEHNDSGRSKLKEISWGFRLLLTNNNLRKITLNTFLYNAIASALMTCFPLIVLRSMGLNGHQYAVILSLGSLGGIAAALLAPHFTEYFGFQRSLLFGILIQIPTILLLPILQNSSLPLKVSECIAYVVMDSFGATLYVIANGTLRQNIVPAHDLAQFQASYKFVTHLGAPVGPLVTALIASFGPMSLVPYIASICFFLLSISVWKWIQEGSLNE